MKRRTKRYNEQYLQKDIASYIKMQYPDVLTTSDLSGVRLSKTQAGIAKAMRSSYFDESDGMIASDKFPDQIIYESRAGFAGLFLEIKKTDENLVAIMDSSKRLAGEWNNDHVRKQSQTMQRLEKKGYFTTFALGFDHAKRIIDCYMNRDTIGLKRDRVLTLEEAKEHNYNRDA